MASIAVEMSGTLKGAIRPPGTKDIASTSYHMRLKPTQVETFMWLRQPPT